MTKETRPEISKSDDLKSREAQLFYDLYNLAQGEPGPTATLDEVIEYAVETSLVRLEAEEISEKQN